MLASAGIFLGIFGYRGGVVAGDTSYRKNIQRWDWIDDCALLVQEVLRILLSPTVDGYRGILRPSEIPSKDDEQDVVLSGQHIEDVRPPECEYRRKERWCCPTTG